jgi:hypothetical protein
MYDLFQARFSDLMVLIRAVSDLVLRASEPGILKEYYYHSNYEVQSR